MTNTYHFILNTHKICILLQIFHLVFPSLSNCLKYRRFHLNLYFSQLENVCQASIWFFASFHLTLKYVRFWKINMTNKLNRKPHTHKRLSAFLRKPHQKNRQHAMKQLQELLWLCVECPESRWWPSSLLLSYCRWRNH